MAPGSIFGPQSPVRPAPPDMFYDTQGVRHTTQ